MERFELFYRSGGHGGPYHGLASAIDGGMRYLVGMPDSDVVRIKPYLQSPEHYQANVRYDSIEIIKARHVCGCSACQACGKTFYHVRTIQTEGY